LLIANPWHHDRMNKATWAMLNDSEQSLLRDAEGSSLDQLDEDELLDLHTRVRRARNKYTTLYRRRASMQVQQAHAQHARTAARAEVFEDALARVSRALARSARARARALRAERLEAARGQARRRASSTRPRVPASGGVQHGPTRRRTPISERASASARAGTRRAEAKREAR
jgi:hypothetical protein